MTTAREQAEAAGIDMSVIGIEDLIKTKETMARDKDLPTLMQLRSIFEQSRS